VLVVISLPFHAPAAAGRTAGPHASVHPPPFLPAWGPSFLASLGFLAVLYAHTLPLRGGDATHAQPLHPIGYLSRRQPPRGGRPCQDRLWSPFSAIRVSHFYLVVGTGPGPLAHAVRPGSPHSSLTPPPSAPLRGACRDERPEHGPTCIIGVCLGRGQHALPPTTVTAPAKPSRVGACVRRPFVHCCFTVTCAGMHSGDPLCFVARLADWPAVGGGARGILAGMLWARTVNRIGRFRLVVDFQWA
jgi:hypothetical protein